jgi:flavorubredoxin
MAKAIIIYGTRSGNTETMKNLAEMDVIEPGLRIKRGPTEKGLEECREFGKKILHSLYNHEISQD